MSSNLCEAVAPSFLTWLFIEGLSLDFTNYETNIFEELHLSKPCAKMTVIAKTESNYFNGITFTVDLISNLKMIKSIWEAVDRLCTNTTLFYIRNLNTVELN